MMAVFYSIMYFGILISVIFFSLQEMRGMPLRNGSQLKYRLNGKPYRVSVLNLCITNFFLVSIFTAVVGLVHDVSCAAYNSLLGVAVA